MRFGCRFRSGKGDVLPREYDIYEFVAGPADGHILEFPSNFLPDIVEFWMKGLKGVPSLFHQYELDPIHSKYRYKGWKWESAGADYSDELWSDPFANVKGYGRLTVWKTLTELSQ